MKAGKIYRASRIGFILFLLTFLFGVAWAAPSNNASPANSFTEEQLQSIVERILHGENVSEAEKNASYPLIQRLRDQGNEPPAIDQTWGPDGYGYAARDIASGVTYSWEDISATGTEVWAGTNQDDTWLSGLNIGFTFPFYGTNYTTFNITSNGFIGFGASNPGYSTTLPTTGYFRIVPFHGTDITTDDYHVDSASHYFYQTLTGPNRLVVQFNGVRAYNSTYRPDPLYTKTFQIILYETGIIKVNYQYIGSLPGTLGYISGIDESASYGFSTYDAANLHAGTTNYAIEYGQPCQMPTALAPANGTLGVPLASSVTWTNGTCATSVDVYFSTNQSLVTASDPSVRVSTGTLVSSYDPPGDMLQGTSYYWRVVGFDATNTPFGSQVMSFLTYSPPLTGIKTIGGTTPDYATFAEAIAALTNAGVGAGGLTFNVRPGTYAERLILNPITGASDVNPIVFQPETGSVTLSGLGTSATTDAMVKLAGCDYVTFDGINIADAGTSSSDYVEYGYWVTNASATDGSQYNTIKNATISLNRDNSSSRPIYSTITTTPTDLTGSNSYNKYLNLWISNARYGMYLVGNTTYRDMNTEIGSTIQGTSNTNRFTIGGTIADDIGGAAAVYGLYLSGQENANVHDIDIRNVSTVGSTSATYGIYNTSNYGTFEFYRNRVYNITNRNTGTSNGSAYGMYVSGAAAMTYNIYNNFFYSIASTSARTSNVTSFYVYGTYLTGNATSVFNVDNNSYLINSGVINPPSDIRYNSSCLHLFTSSFNIHNNIFYNKTENQTTSKHYGVYRSSGTITSSDNNVFYIPNTTNGFVGYYTSDRATIADWQTGSLQDPTSVSGNPMYVDDTGSNLHIQSPIGFTPVEGTAQSVAWVTTDIDGEARLAPPDIGADDGTFVSATAPEPAVNVSPANSATGIAADATLNWTNGANVNNVDVYFSTVMADVQSLAIGARVVSAQLVTTYDPPGNLSDGTYYYWRIVGRNTSSGETVNGEVWQFQTIQPPLVGTKYIGGTTPDYLNFTAALNALALGGVGDGGVTFMVRTGDYPERITVNPPVNSSATNPVVFQKETGTVTMVGTGTSATNDAIIWLNGCDYVTFDGIDVLDAGTSSTNYAEYGYYVTPNGSSTTDGATYNTIQNCRIQMHKANTGSYGVRQYYVTTPTAQTGTNSYNRYLNLKVTDTYYGVYLYSTSSSTYYDTDNEVGSTSTSLSDPNRFVIGSGVGEDIGNYGLYLYYGNNYNVHDIDVRGVSSSSTSTTLYGMYVYYVRGTNPITRCRVFDMTNAGGGTSSTVTMRGMYLYPQATGTVNAYNNFVYGFSHPRTTETTSQYIQAIYSANSGTVNLNYNTVVISSTAGAGVTSSAWYIAGGNVTARNNIFFNNTPAQTTANHYGIYRSSATSFTSDYNDIYAPNANGWTGYFAANQADLSAWRTASGQDAASISSDPMLISEATDPHVGIASNSLVESAGTPIAEITTDIDSEVRNATNPDIGADEGQFVDPSSPSNGALSSITLNSMLLGWQDNTTDELGFPVYISTDGTTFTLYGTGNPGDVSMPITGLSLGTHYWFRVFAQRPGGPTPGYANANGWTLVYGADIGGGIAMSASLVDPGYITAVINSITDNTGNPAGTYYRIRDVISGNYINSTGSLGATPRTALGTNWNAFNLTGLGRGVSYQFVPIACNGGGVEATPVGTMFPLTMNDYATSGGPDGGGYYFRTSAAPGGPAYSWIDISTTGTDLAISGDDATLALPLGTFTFPFYGTTVTNLTASTNGNLQVGTTGSSGYTNNGLPTSSLNAGAICIFWDDLQMDAGTHWCKYQDLGDGRFVVTFYARDRNGGAAGYRHFYFQYIIYNSGRIVFQYGPANSGDPSYTTGAIGIQGATTGTLFTMYGENNIAMPAEGWAIQFSQGAPPAAPSAPSPADLATGVSLTPTLGWTSDGTTYDVYFGTDNPPATAVSMGQAGSTYAITTPLTQNTLYYWKVVANNTFGATPGAVWSFTTASAPSVPVVTVAYSGGNAVLTWPASTGTITGYHVYRHTTGYFTPPATGTLIGSTDAATLTYSDLGVNGQYYYRVTAYNEASTASLPRNNEETVRISPRYNSSDPAYGTPWPRALGINRDVPKENQK